MSSGSRVFFPFLKNRLAQEVSGVAYRIDYMPVNTRIDKGPGIRVLVMTVGFAVLFGALVSHFWPEGREILRAVLIPGDPDVTLEAAEVFAGELSSGFSLADAARNFCVTVLEHGNPG